VKDLKAKQIDYQSSQKPPYFVLIIPIGAFGLGCWQIQRLGWKKNLIKELDAKTKGAPAELPDDLNELEHKEYYNFKVKGVFEHDKEMFISPRQELGLEESGDRGGMVSSSHGIGSHVITPLVITQGIHEGLRIIINRGWVPLKKMDPTTRVQGQIEGEVEIVGILRHTDKGSYVADNDKQSNVWQKRDLYGLAEKLNALPVFLDANIASSVEGGPIGGQTRVNLRNEHMSYILTWFSLSVLTSAMWMYRYRKPMAFRVT